MFLLTMEASLKAGDVSLKGSRSEVASGDAGVISKINSDLESSEINSTSYSISFNASGAHRVWFRLDWIFLRKLVKNRLLSKNIIQAIVNLQNGKHLQSDLVIPEIMQTLKAAKMAQRLLSLHRGQWLLIWKYNPAGVSNLLR